MSAFAPVRITHNTARAEAFIVKHFDKPEVDHSADFLLELELARVLTATNKAAISSNKITGSTAGDEPNDFTMVIPRIMRTTSFTSTNTAISTSASIDSQLSTTSTAGTTPYHSRSSSKAEEKPPNLSSSHNITNLSDGLKQLDIQQKKDAGTGLEIPRNATPSQIPKAQPHKKDPWTLEYPAPTTELDIAACLARPKLAGTPFERLAAARAAMSPAQRAAYDAKQEAEVGARHKVLESQHSENTIKNLTRPLGYAAAFNKAEKVKRPPTFMNGYGWWEEWDKKEGGFKVVEGQTVRYARTAPPSKQVAEEEAMRQADVQAMWEQ